MNLDLKKCGNYYIKFDKNKNPIYAFEIGYKAIKKFHLFCDEMPKTVVLPKLKLERSQPDNRAIFNEIKLLEKVPDIFGGEIPINDYAKGAYKIEEECFKGIKDLKVIVPVDYSIMLDWGCFDDDANIELVLPKDMNLKQIYRRFSDGYESKNENWTLIAHKDFNYESKCFEGIYARDYIPQNSFVNYKISKKSVEDLMNKSNNKTSSKTIAKNKQNKDNFEL